MTEVFVRRVSFNNISPDLLDHSVHEPPQLRNTKTKLDPNFGYGNTKFDDPLQLFNTGGRRGSMSSVPTTHRKIPKLPDPPSKSILKHFDADSNKTTNTTINYHDEKDIEEAATKSSEESPKDFRKKSLSEMTNEEIMLLDQQYNSNLKIENFKFDNSTTYYNNNRRESVSTNKVNLNSGLNYPTRPTINHESVNLSVQHKLYPTTVIEVDDHTTKPNRTLLTFISGRKHSWNSVEWILHSDFLADGDHIVVAALISNKIPANSSLILKKCQNVMSYLTGGLDANLKIKITVEFMIDNKPDSSITKTEQKEFGSKYMINEVVKLYQPNLIIMGTKSASLNFSYFKKNIAKNVVKLPSYMIKRSVVPVIVINNKASRSYTKSPGKAEDDDSASIISIESDLIFQPDSNDDLDGLMNYSLSEEKKYSSMLAKISDESLHDAINYLEFERSNKEGSPHSPLSPFSSSPADMLHAVPKIQFNSENLSMTRDLTANNKLHKIKSLLDESSTSSQTNKVHKVKSLLGDPEPFVGNELTRTLSKTKSAELIQQRRKSSIGSETLTKSQSTKSADNRSKSMSGSVEGSSGGGFWKKMGLKKK